MCIVYNVYIKHQTIHCSNFWHMAPGFWWVKNIVLQNQISSKETWPGSDSPWLTIRFCHVLPWIVMFHMSSTLFRFQNVLGCARLHGTTLLQMFNHSISYRLSASLQSDPCEHNKFGASRSVGRGTWPAFQKSKPFRRFSSPDSGYSGFCPMPPRKS